MSAVPPLAAVHIFGVPRRHIPRALVRMGRDGRDLRSTPGLRFARLLGTNDGSTFTLSSNDLRHWAIVSSWTSTDAARDFELSPVIRRWARISEERLHVRLRPLASRGRWAGQEPFGTPTPTPVSGPVASITRARIVPRKSVQFWRAVPPVAADLAGTARRTAGHRGRRGAGRLPRDVLDLGLDPGRHRLRPPRRGPPGRRPADRGGTLVRRGAVRTVRGPRHRGHVRRPHAVAPAVTHQPEEGRHRWVPSSCPGSSRPAGPAASTPTPRSSSSACSAATPTSARSRTA